MKRIAHEIQQINDAFIAREKSKETTTLQIEIVVIHFILDPQTSPSSADAAFKLYSSGNLNQAVAIANGKTTMSSEGSASHQGMKPIIRKKLMQRIVSLMLQERKIS